MKLRIQEIVRNPLTRARYRIGELLGEGGYGRAYRAHLLSETNRRVAEVCFKTTTDQTSWQRESYFGELLTGNRRVIRTIESFPCPPKNRRGRMMFCLVMELAEHGTIADYLERTARPWTQTRAVREISALLKVLDQLHGVNATHRDITPMNIFVCRGGTLKLGDFGIARHELSGKPMTIEAFNPDFVTRGFRDSRHRHWMAVDDVFQMGQLLAMLLRGDASVTARPRDINELDCDEQLKRIIKRAIGPRSKRFSDAFEMLQSLRGDEESGAADIRTLSGRTIAFSGPMSMQRFDAEVLVLQAGGEVVRDISSNVDVVVQGGRYRKSQPSTNRLRRVQKLIRKGRRIHLIGEAQFRRLVKPVK